jgi:anti-anti-sigma regulatory factor
MDRGEATWLVRLPAQCSIGAARALHDLVQGALRTSARVELDCSAVETSDVTSLQILLSAAVSARRDGGSVALRALSAPLSGSFSRAGFALPAVASETLLANGRA